MVVVGNRDEEEEEEERIGEVDTVVGGGGGGAGRSRHGFLGRSFFGHRKLEVRMDVVMCYFSLLSSLPPLSLSSPLSPLPISLFFSPPLSH